MAVDPVALRAFQEEARKRNYSPQQIQAASNHFIKQAGGQQGFIESAFINPVRRGAEALAEAGKRGYEFLTNRAVAEAGGFEGFGPTIAGRKLFAPKTPITEEERQAASKKILSKDRVFGLAPMSEAELQSPGSIANTVARRVAGTASVLASFAAPGAGGAITSIASKVPVINKLAPAMINMNRAMGVAPGFWTSVKTGAALSGLGTYGAGGKAGEVATGTLAGGAFGGLAYGGTKLAKKIFSPQTAEGVSKVAKKGTKIVEGAQVKPQVKGDINAFTPIKLEKQVEGIRNLTRHGKAVDLIATPEKQSRQVADLATIIKNKAIARTERLNKSNAPLPTELSDIGRIKAAFWNLLQKKNKLITKDQFTQYLNRLDNLMGDDTQRIKPSDIVNVKVQLGNMAEQLGIWKIPSNTPLNPDQMTVNTMWQVMDDVIKKVDPELGKLLKELSQLHNWQKNVFASLGKTTNAWVPIPTPLGVMPLPIKSTMAHQTQSMAAEGIGRIFNYIGSGTAKISENAAKAANVNVPKWANGLLISLPTIGGIGMRGAAAQEILSSPFTKEVPTAAEMTIQAIAADNANKGISPDGLYRWNKNTNKWDLTEDGFAWMTTYDVLNNNGKNLTKINAYKASLTPKVGQMDAITKRKYSQMETARAILNQYKKFIDDMNVPDNMAMARASGYLRKWTAVLANDPRPTTFDSMKGGLASAIAMAFGEVGMKTEGDIARARMLSADYNKSKGENDLLLQQVLEMINNAQAAMIAGAKITGSELPSQSSVNYYNPDVNSLPVTPGLTP